MNPISSVVDDKIAETVINQGYGDFNVVPLSAVLTGSRAYGLNSDESDYDFVGFHVMDSWYCFEHPDFRSNLQVIKTMFDENLDEIPPGQKNSYISLDSFELWKFLTLYNKGSFVAHELLYQPAIHHDNSAEGLVRLMRKGATNRIGLAAKGNALHDWRRQKANKKKAVMAVYRLLQGIHFLNEEEFVWDAKILWEYGDKVLDIANDILESYLNKDTRKDSLTEDEQLFLGQEINILINAIDRARITTRLPDRCPSKVHTAIRQYMINMRGTMI